QSLQSGCAERRPGGHRSYTNDLARTSKACQAAPGAKSWLCRIINQLPSTVVHKASKRVQCGMRGSSHVLHVCIQTVISGTPLAGAGRRERQDEADETPLEGERQNPR